MCPSFAEKLLLTIGKAVVSQKRFVIAYTHDNVPLPIFFFFLFFFFFSFFKSPSAFFTFFVIFHLSFSRYFYFFPFLFSLSPSITLVHSVFHVLLELVIVPFGRSEISERKKNEKPIVPTPRPNMICRFGKLFLPHLFDIVTFVSFSPDEKFHVHLSVPSIFNFFSPKCCQFALVSFPRQ